MSPKQLAKMGRLFFFLLPPIWLSACSPLPPKVDTADYVPLALAPASVTGVRDRRGDFRAMFCEERTGDSASTETCDAALRRFRGELPATDHLSILPRERPRYRVALALGMGWDCMRGLIDEPRLPTAALASAGYDTLLLEVEGLSSSERNAEIIAESLKNQLARGDDRPFILVGYSKGAPDILVALERHPELIDHVAAFVTVAGAIGGSPVAEHTSGYTMAALKYSPYGDCARGDDRVLTSLHPARRQAWLADNLPLPVPSYSLITAPEPARVSRALRSSYKLLGAVHPINDGALLHWDQLLPGSTLLGYANADHWAVTVPIDVDDIPLGSFLISNGYPRSRLWLAIADFVVADLQADGQLTATSREKGRE